MMPIYFRSRAREAALQVLDNTSLGERIANAMEDEGGLLAIHASHDLLDSLSSGEEALYHFVAALGGHGCVNLYELLNRVDDNCALHCFWSLGVLAGHASHIEVPS